MSPMMVRLLIVNSIAFSAAFFAVACCMFYFLSNRNAGHRTLMGLQSAFFTFGGIRYAYSAYALWNKKPELNPILIVVSMALCWSYAGYLVASRKDVLSTLIKSEAKNREFHDEISDIQTTTSGLLVRAEAGQQRAAELNRAYSKPMNVQSIKQVG